jgi:D-sedoheptulose 7-phosphate isomerase
VAKKCWRAETAEARLMRPIFVPSWPAASSKIAPYPAMNLAQGASLLTATGNDYGFEEIFARQVRAFGNEGDLLIAITTTGKSKNIRRALEEAKARKLKTISLLGRDGGPTAGIADVDLTVKGDSTARIQEAHKFILHVICEICETRLPRK